MQPPQSTTQEAIDSVLNKGIDYKKKVADDGNVNKAKQSEQ